MELKERMREADDLLKRQQDDQKSVSADMTRQYKTMQTEMNIKIHQLEKEKERLTIGEPLHFIDPFCHSSMVREGLPNSVEKYSSDVKLNR